MNQASRRKYHYIYKITRTDGSGKYYIGMHSTDDLDDGYFGSGQKLWKSIRKHGKEKHVKEILEYLPSREALKLREKEIVTEELLGDKLCMNLALGGCGFNGSEVAAWWKIEEYRANVLKKQAEYWSKPENVEAQRRLKLKQYEDQSLRNRVGEASEKAWSDPVKKADQSERKKKHWQDSTYRKKTIAAQNEGKRTETYRKTASERMIQNHPTRGTRWIHSLHLKSSKLISKNEPLPAGWAEGRKMFK